MFREIKEWFSKEIAYRQKLKEAEYQEKLNSVGEEAKIRNKLRLESLKKKGPSPKGFKLGSKVKPSYENKKVENIMNMEV